MSQARVVKISPKIITFPSTTLLVKSMPMSFAEDKTQELWREFTPLMNSIRDRIDSDRYSVQVYPNTDFFNPFDINKMFIKYAGIKINPVEHLSDNTQQLIIPEGHYVSVNYIGRPRHADKVFQYIFYDWLPNSEYCLDNRPHIAIMEKTYKGDHDDSEEQFLIPIKFVE